jgi:hypothetical protein
MEQMMYENLSVCALNAEQHLRTCGYWYVVTDRASPHTAFATQRGLLRWMEERGLSVDAVPKAVAPLDSGKGLSNHCRIHGKYATRTHMSMDAFYALPNVVVRTKALCNGDYVEALITQEDGYRTVHTLNPNVRDRKVFDYRDTRAEMS